MESIRITTLDWKKKKLHISGELSGPGEAEFSVWDGEACLFRGKASGTGRVELSTELAGAELWSCECPKLYKLRAVFGQDVQEIPLWNSADYGEQQRRILHQRGTGDLERSLCPS